jgi:hypothetical protein
MRLDYVLALAASAGLVSAKSNDKSKCKPRPKPTTGDPLGTVSSINHGGGYDPGTLSEPTGTGSWTGHHPSGRPSGDGHTSGSGHSAGSSYSSDSASHTGTSGSVTGSNTYSTTQSHTDSTTQSTGSTTQSTDNTTSQPTSTASTDVPGPSQMCKAKGKKTNGPPIKTSKKFTDFTFKGCKAFCASVPECKSFSIEIKTGGVCSLFDKPVHVGFTFRGGQENILFFDAGCPTPTADVSTTYG